VQPLLARYPLGFAQWLVALSYALAHPREIAIVGNVASPAARALLQTCAGYRPHQVIALGEDGGVPLLRGREQVEGQATAYVCTDHTCRRPATEPEALEAALEGEK
jgi:hypothetical protein